MKKVHLIAVAFSLVLTAGEKADAQGHGAASVSPLITVNTRAVRNFVKSYESAVDPEWVALKEGGWQCNFIVDGIRSRAFYTKKGNWLGTLASYNENKLSRDVRAIVKSTYYDYTITYIDEITVPGESKIYLVQIQDDKALKVLRISDNDMETMRELVKLPAR